MSLPVPLVPSDVDLTDFPFMPLLIARLKQSRAWLICKRRPELAFYMVNLWTASWHARPAASLENDDDVLADLAMCPPKTWKTIRSDVLRGWTECEDGRLYHPVVAEQALLSWGRKVSQRLRTEAARREREARRKGKEAAATVSVTETVAEDVTASKGQGQGQGQRQGQGQGQGQGDIYPSLRSGGAGAGAHEAQPKIEQATRIPADWTLDEEGRAYARSQGLADDEVDRRAEDFRDYWLAEDSPKAVKRDWRAAWRTWIRDQRRPPQAPSMLLPLNGGKHPSSGNGAAKTQPTTGGMAAAAALGSRSTRRQEIR